MPLTTKQAAALKGVIPRRIQALAKQGRIHGATKHGTDWLIPDDFVVKPAVRRGTQQRSKG